MENLPKIGEFMDAVAPTLNHETIRSVRYVKY